MPLPRLTRKDIRRSIGHDLGGTLHAGMVIGYASEFTSTTLTDYGLIGAATEGRGRFVVIEGHIAVVTGYNPETSVLTFTPEHPDPPTSEGDYELWERQYDPRRINLSNEPGYHRC